MSFWSLYLLHGHNHGPPILRRLSLWLSKRLTPWQTLVITLVWLYISRNFAKIMGLECPEPLANLYTRAYFRATWVTTALDAGFWTAMRIRRPWLRDLVSIACSVYYLFAAEQAEEKVKMVRGCLTLEHLRVSWNKGTTPYLAFLSGLLRPRLARYGPKKIRIPRPRESSYREPVAAWLYFDGPFSAIARHTNVVLDIPGGGFVAMDPRTNDDKLFAWSGKTGLPILSLDYKKAPEFPYPYALDECFDVYSTLVATNGRCIGLSGETRPRIVLAGDSAGGNLAAAVALMILQSRKSYDQLHPSGDMLPAPDGLVLMYPALDMNINSWMTDEQMSLIQDQRTRAGQRSVLRKKSQDYYRLDPSTPQPSDDDGEHMLTPTASRPFSFPESAIDSEPATPSGDSSPAQTRRPSVVQQQGAIALSKPRIQKTRLAMSSMISYFNDRILTPEMMRAMIILYVGPHARPDFTTDFLLSPLLAPEALLAEFPKTYLLTGERDPLVDDTVIFAGRLRQAKLGAFVQQQELGLKEPGEKFREKDHVEVALIPGISHGFIQFVGVFPQGWDHIFRCGRWIEDLFALSSPSPAEDPRPRPVRKARRLTNSTTVGEEGSKDNQLSREPSDSSGEEDRPLEMTPVNGGAAAAAKSPKSSRPREKQKKNGRALKRPKSGLRLGSQEDLLKRRMNGLAESLMGAAGVERDGL